MEDLVRSMKKLVNIRQEIIMAQKLVKSSMKRQMALVLSGKNAVTRHAIQKNLDMKNASLTSFRNNL